MMKRIFPDYFLSRNVGEIIGFILPQALEVTLFNLTFFFCFAKDVMSKIYSFFPFSPQ